LYPVGIYWSFEEHPKSNGGRGSMTISHMLCIPKNQQSYSQHGVSFLHSDCT
jgi:hypothetical protein